MPLSMRIAGRVIALELEGARKGPQPDEQLVAARIDFSKDPNIVVGVFHDLKVFLPSVSASDIYLGQDVVCEFQFVAFNPDADPQ